MTELRGINWAKFLRDILSSKGLRYRSLQWACSEGLRQQKYMCIKLDSIEDTVLEYKGSKFYADVPNYFHIFSVYEDYPLDLIKASDTILDLGANIGSFSIPAAKIAKRVYAVEPLTVNLLRKNIELNALTNIDILEEGVGKEGSREIEFLGLRKVCRTSTLSNILSRIGRIDYIKIDIEGSEWLIDPSEFEGVRLVTGEVHLYSRDNNWAQWLDWFKYRGYSMDIRGSWSKEKRFTAIRKVL